MSEKYLHDCWLIVENIELNLTLQLCNVSQQFFGIVLKSQIVNVETTYMIITKNIIGIEKRRIEMIFLMLKNLP